MLCKHSQQILVKNVPFYDFTTKRAKRTPSRESCLIFLEKNIHSHQKNIVKLLSYSSWCEQCDEGGKTTVVWKISPFGDPIWLQLNILEESYTNFVFVEIPFGNWTYLTIGFIYFFPEYNSAFIDNMWSACENNLLISERNIDNE
jgi:hypothetical protein